MEVCWVFWVLRAELPVDFLEVFGCIFWRFVGIHWAFTGIVGMIHWVLS